MRISVKEHRCHSDLRKCVQNDLLPLLLVESVRPRFLPLLRVSTTITGLRRSCLSKTSRSSPIEIGKSCMVRCETVRKQKGILFLCPQRIGSSNSVVRPFPISLRLLETSLTATCFTWFRVTSNKQSKNELLFQYCLDFGRHCVEMEMILVMMELAFSIHS